MGSKWAPCGDDQEAAVRQEVPFVITISRQLGSGGACIGRKVATELGVHYADRDILERAARSLDVSEAHVEACEETAPSFFQSALSAYSLGGPDWVCIAPLDVPSYVEVREAESRAVLELAAVRSAVIVGRAGFHLLRSHPRHLSVFLHADLAFRVQRIQEICELSPQRALARIEETERARGRYLEQLTGRPWTDAVQYDLSICTSSIGLDRAASLICALARDRFGLGSASAA